MARATEESNQIIDKIEATFAVYNKAINPKAIMVWMDQLKNYSTEEILNAFDDHVAGKSLDRNTNHSHYAPKPIHIIQHIQAHRDRKKSFKKNEQEKNEVLARPEIAKAWVVFMRHALNYEHTLDRNPDIEMSFERALKICNEQAAKHNTPDAIPDQYKLPEYWQDYDVAI